YEPVVIFRLAYYITQWNLCPTVCHQNSVTSHQVQLLSVHPNVVKYGVTCRDLRRGIHSFLSKLWNSRAGMKMISRPR
ncbi:hypothetical protein FGIG_11089, partial [Fasciola gigantica]